NRSDAVLTDTGSRPGRLHPGSVAVGVEEEFHTVDLKTRRLTAQADSLVEQLPASSFSSELQRSVLEANSRPWSAWLTSLRTSPLCGGPPSPRRNRSGW